MTLGLGGKGSGLINPGSTFGEARLGSALAAPNRTLLLLRAWGGPAFSIAGLVVMSGSLSYFLGSDDDTGDAAAGSKLRQLVTGAIFMVAALRVAFDLRGFLTLCRSSLLLVGFVLLVLASVAWSPVPEIALRRAIAFFGTTLFAAYLVLYYRPEALLKLFAIALGVVVALQVLGTVAFSGWAFGAQGLRGVMGQKNDFGRLMALAAITLWFFCSPRSLPGLAAIAGFIGAVGLTFLSKSRTAWVLLLAGLGLALPATIWLREQRLTLPLRFVTIGTVLATAAIVGPLLYVPVLEALGKDPTLTNRTVIWELLYQIGMMHPWLGVGYGSFWLSQYGAIFVDRWGMIGHAHNGYLDFWLALGLVGLCALVLNLLNLFRRTIVRMISGAQSVHGLCGDRHGLHHHRQLGREADPDDVSITWMLFVVLTLASRKRSLRGAQ